ncbi:MAG TPA: SDR family NAD(P)-dependent oxidoreductase [Bacillota bacterium]|nr:SDR family NAD(P)-dependent oxidoreductase [Bacillota bacterium]
MEKLYRYIIENVTSGKMDQQIGASMLKMLKNEVAIAVDDIAIIGVAAKLPYADNIDEFWENIVNKVDGIGSLPATRARDLKNYFTYTNSPEAENLKFFDGAFIDDIDTFDYKLFKLSPKEASLMDPYQRLFLQTVWHAIEDAGYGGKSLVKSSTGVFVGFASNARDSYLKMVHDVDQDLLSAAAVGNITAMLPTRIAYLLDLKGPTMVLDTACSSAMYAVHLACQSIKNGDCEMAIAGSVRMNLIPLDKEYMKTGVESSDDRTRAFDQNSDGASAGEGIIAVLLKPLSKAKKDGDHIYAVIKGSAVNQDGTSIGITAPNPDSQTAVILKAWENAGIDPLTLSYIEAHGTGTKLGDPLEIDGLKRAFRKYSDKNQVCPIGTIKTNLGHLYESSGLAGLLKAMMILKHRQIPPSIHFNQPNSQIDFTDSPVFVNTKSRKWQSKGAPMRCAISSFGLSGTNCHMILEEAPPVPEAVSGPGPYLFVLSAKSETSLMDNLKVYQHFIAQKKSINLEDLCYTAGIGRGHFEYRLALIVNDIEDLSGKIGKILNDLNLNNTAETLHYYGIHRIVSGNKDSKGSGEITEAEKNELNNKARSVIALFQETGRKNLDLLQSICCFYIEGADINWSQFYKDSKPRRISIPGYSFEHNRNWLDIPETITVSAAKDELYYTLQWKPAELKDASLKLSPGPMLVFVDGIGIGAQLIAGFRNENQPVIEVALGPEFSRMEPEKYMIKNTLEDYEQLLNEINADSFSQIIHLASIGSRKEVNCLDELEQGQQMGLYSLTHLIKALARKGITGETKFSVITEYVNTVTGEEPAIHLENGPLFGLGRVMTREIPELSFSCIDIDEFTEIGALMAELKATGNSGGIAYRNGQRYTEEFAEVNLNLAETREITLQPDGLYLITGGTGGMGLEMAQFLAGKSNIKLALINRTPAPARETWEHILKSGADDKLCRKIKRIQEIESAGSKVFCYAADISNPDETETLIAKLRQEHGKIHGIIHTAGISGHEMIITETEANMRQVLAVKVQGTWLLDQLTRNDPPDFFVVCSSIATIYCAPGQGAYAAANSFLDSFTAYRNHQGLRTLCINWTTWKETGMAVDTGTNIDTAFKALPTAQAMEGFAGAFDKTIPRIVIGIINYEGGKAALLERTSIKLAANIVKAIEKSREHLTSRQKTNRGSLKGEVKLIGRDDQEYTAIEKKVAEICREILGFEEISIHDTFFELGADSIILKRMHTRLDELYPGKVMIAELFEYSSVFKLAQYITGKQCAPELIKGKIKSQGTQKAGDIAIIGMAAELPNACDVETFWGNIRNGLDCITSFPDSRRRDIDRFLKAIDFPPEDIKYLDCAYLQEIDKFDANYFRLSPNEANLMDPNQRLFLQTVWQAIEAAGYGGKKLSGSKTGVYVGFSGSIKDSYQRMISEIDPASLPIATTGNFNAMLPSRVSYLLDLKGPTMVVDTACSSSLVVVDLACQAIRNGYCEMAVAGGIKLQTIPLDMEISKIGIESSDSRTRTFDDNADGAGIGEGLGVVLLKPLEAALADGDQIHAIIKGSAVNQDGNAISLGAPNPASQTDVILNAWENAGIDPETVSYIITHGTATNLGDPIEIKSIQNAFRRYTDKKQFCAVSSVKTNIGHIFEAAGIINLIQGVLALKHQEIPASIYFNKPNRTIGFEDSPIYINTRLRRWTTEGYPRRLGINAFGFSGTNCHLVLEEAPVIAGDITESDSLRVLCLSAKTETALAEMIKQYSEYIETHPILSLDSLCYTANTGRGHYNYRLAILFNDRSGLQAKLENLQRSLQPKPESGVFCGKHRVIPGNKGVKAADDITENEQYKLTELAAEKLRSLAPSENNEPGILKNLIELYVQGADIDWEALYPDPKPQKLGLPVYPFERKRHWLDVPDSDDEANELSSQLFYGIQWQQEAIPADNQQFAPGVVLVLGDEKGIGIDITKRLRDADRIVYEVVWGKAFEKVDSQSYIIQGVAEDYERLISEINQPISQIIHLFTITQNNTVTTLDGLKESQRRGVYSLLYLTRAVLKNATQKDLKFTLISELVNEVTGLESKIIPENASFLGMGKVIGQEYFNITCQGIDIDESTAPETIMAELGVNQKYYLTAYRNGNRYIEQFGEVIVPEYPEAKIDVKKDGVYLITGGTGGIGNEIARSLASQNQITLAFIGRTPIPGRKKWTQILKENEDPALCAKIKAIQEIEAMGSKVVYFSADVSQMDEMKVAVEKIHSKYGAINGVIHSAGVAGAGYILRKDEAAFNRVFEPKVQGTWILDQITQSDPLDFFVMFSSAVTQSGEAGQSDYVAGNSYLDSYTYQRNKTGRRTLTINWVSWKEAGMSVRFGINVDSIFKALPSSQAVSGFNQVLCSNLKRVVIGELNFANKSLIHILNALPHKLSAKLTEIASVYAAKYQNLSGSQVFDKDGYEMAVVDQGRLAFVPRGKRPLASQKNIQVKLSGNEQNEYSPIEMELGKIYGEVLGVIEINIHDSFFELGGDSILLTRVYRLLDAKYPGITKLADLYAYTSIISLALFIARKLQDPNTEETRGSGFFVIEPVPDNDYYPMSSVQRRLYYINQIDPESLNYNLSRASILEGDLEVERVKDILAQMIRRHEALRTSFELLDGALIQRVHPEIDFKVDVIQGDEPSLDNLIKNYVRPFNLGKAPLFRVALIRLAEQKYVILFDMHHIIADGVTMDILNWEFTELYAGRPLPELKLQYPDFTAWQENLRDSEFMKGQAEYWRSVFRTEILTLNLPVDFQRPDVKSYEGHTISFELDRETTGQLMNITTENGWTLYMVLLAAFNVFLYKCTAQEDIIVGSPATGRSHLDLDTMVGMFVNMLAMRNYPKRNKTFKEFVNEVRENTLNALKNQDYQFEDLIASLNLKRTLNRNPIFDVVFALQNVGTIESKISNFNIRRYEFDNRISLFDIYMEAIEKEGVLHFNLQYWTKLFKTETVERMTRDYLSVLQMIMANVNIKIGDIEFENEKEFRKTYGTEEELEFNF